MVTLKDIQVLNYKLASTYESSEKILEHYKDFDITKAMLEKKGENILWCRARAIDADVCNANGDLFEEEELLRETEIKKRNEDGEVKTIKVPVYKTFEGVPIFRNHDNKDITKAMGQVVFAEWCDKEKAVFCTFFVDGDAYPEVVRGIRLKYMTDVSMGCSISHGICNICGKEAYTEQDYCKHQLKYKGRIDPESNKKVFEKNKGVKFFELSVVRDGAFESCEIEAVMNADEVIELAHKLKEKIAMYNGVLDRGTINVDFPEFYSVSKGIISRAEKLSQINLSGGAFLAQEGAPANSTIAKILQYLGINPQTGLNILDMLNLALNFLEVAVLNLFSRKDNIDLSHVGKITKSMADLQNVMQDVIDEGLDQGSPASQNGVQMPQNSGQQTPQNNSGSQDTPQQQQQNYDSPGAVGKSIAPQNNLQTQTQALPLGGGVVSANNKYNRMVIWNFSEDNE